MIRKIIHIDEEKCNGCGLCATACHEGAIDIINGKAKLVRENFCDGFGDCLPGCPTGAITFEEREAPAYDEAAVQENKKKKELQEKMKHLHEGGCPGSRMRMLEGEPIQPAQVRRLSQKGETAVLEVIIHQGKNRQIRRMCRQAGLSVLRLRRVQEHTLHLGNLPSGKWRYLTDGELQDLKGSDGVE